MRPIFTFVAIVLCMVTYDVAILAAEEKPAPDASASEQSSPKPGEKADETVPREFWGFADVSGFRGVIDDPDGYVNLRKEKSTDGPVITKVKAGEPFSFERQGHDQWCKVKLSSGKTGWMHASRIRLFFTKDDLPNKPGNGDEIDEQAAKQGINYYEVTQAAARGDQKALKTFFSIAGDGAGAEEHMGVIAVMIHLVGDHALAEFLQRQPLDFQFKVRNALDDNVTWPFRSLPYLQLHFPKTSKLFFRREIDFQSPDGRYTIHKVFSEEEPTEDSEVTQSLLIDKRAGKVIKDLTADDKGRGLYREGDVEWAPDSNAFLYFGEGLIKPEAYQLSGKSFVKVEIPSLDDPRLTECDAKLGDAYPGLEKIHWSKPGKLVCKKTCYYKSTDKSGADQKLQRAYEITMTIGPDGKLAIEEKPVENSE